MGEPRIGAYALLERLGSGSMGTVWRARPPWSRQDVALKVLRTRDLGTRARRWVDAELRATAALDHRHVVTLLDAGRAAASDARPEGVEVEDPWLVMELADGDLSQWIGQIRWRRWVEALDQILDGLAHAHARGLLHGDLKPANILLRDQDAVIADFGLATWSARPRRSRAGTPSFMAPEIIQGRADRIGAWSDLYAVGCLGWTLLTGEPPFERDTVDQTLRAHVEDPLPPLPDDVPAAAAQWLTTLLSRAPHDRFQTAADARLALASVDRSSGPDGAAPGVRPESRSTWQTGWVPDEPATDEVDPALVAAAQPAPREVPDWRAAGVVRSPLPRHGAKLSLVGLRTLPLVGREALQSTLWEALQHVAATGGMQSREVRGPPGVGASRLVAWVAERAYELGAAWPVRFEPTPDGALAVRGLTALPGFVPPDGDLTAQVWAVARWIRRSGRPAVVVTAQLGPETRRALERAWASANAVAPVAALVLTASSEAPAADALEVQPLAASDATELVRQVLDLDDVVVSRVVEVSEGRPGVILDVIAHWVERGHVRPGPDGRWVATGTTLSLPAGLADATAERVADALAAVPAEARPLIGAAAHLVPHDPALWMRVVQEAGFDPALADGWLAPLREAPSLLAWLRAETQRDGTAADHHRRLLRAAEAGGFGAERCAWHGWHAGQLEAGTALLDAATAHIDAGRLDRGLVLLGALEPELDALSELDPDAWGRWCYLRTGIAYRTGRAVEATQWVEHAASRPTSAALRQRITLLHAHVASLTDENLDARIAELEGLPVNAGVLHARASLHLSRGNPRAAMEVLDAHPDAWGEHAGWERQLRALAAMMLGEVGEALGLARWALLHETRDGAAWRVPFRELTLGLALTAAGRLDEAEAVVRRALRGFERRGNAHGVRNALHALAKGALLGGRTETAETLSRRAIRLSEILGVPTSDHRLVLAHSELSEGAHREWAAPLARLHTTFARSGTRNLLLAAARAEVAAHGADSWGERRAELAALLEDTGAVDALAGRSLERAAEALAADAAHGEAAWARATAAAQLAGFRGPEG